MTDSVIAKLNRQRTKSAVALMGKEVIVSDERVTLVQRETRTGQIFIVRSANGQHRRVHASAIRCEAK